MRLVSAEFLKIRKRLGLVSATLGLTVVPALIALVITGDGDPDTGGMRSFADQVGMVAMLSLVAGILVGATLGTSDTSSGVFRDLVVTGRSRLDLYAARVPAGLALVLVAAAAGFAIAVVSAHLSAGALPATHDRLGTVAPTGTVVVQSGMWLAVVTAVGFALSLGVSSAVGSRGGSIALLLALWLVVTPLVQNADPDSWALDLLVISGLDRVMPEGMRVGDPVSHTSLAAGIVVLLAWTVLPLLAGALRTMTRDA